MSTFCFLIATMMLPSLVHYNELRHFFKVPTDIKETKGDEGDIVFQDVYLYRRVWHKTCKKWSQYWELHSIDTSMSKVLLIPLDIEYSHETVLRQVVSRGYLKNTSWIYISFYEQKALCPIYVSAILYRFNFYLTFYTKLHSPVVASKTSNWRVVGSIPAGGRFFFIKRHKSDILRGTWISQLRTYSDGQESRKIVMNRIGHESSNGHATLRYLFSATFVPETLLP